MNKILPFLGLCLCFLYPQKAVAQDSAAYWLNTIDTAALYDSLLQELRTLGLVKKQGGSFFDVNAGISNGSFALRNSAAGSATSTVFGNMGMGYYHRSGFSLSAGINTSSGNGTFQVFQGYLSPAFDWRKKTFSTGISYYRYFNRDNLNFYLSPLVHEIYGYFLWKKSWLQPKLALDYGFGTTEQVQGLTSIDTIRNKRLASFVRNLSARPRLSRVSDFSIQASVRHDFISLNKKHRTRFFRYTPGLMLLLGTGTYGTNAPMGSLNGPLFENMTGSRVLHELNKNPFLEQEVSIGLQNLSLMQVAAYHAGAFYVQGQLNFTYLFPKAQSGWRGYFNLTAGLTL